MNLWKFYIRLKLRARCCICIDCPSRNVIRTRTHSMFSSPQWQSALANLWSLRPAWLWGVRSGEQAAAEEAWAKPSFYTPRLLWVLYGIVSFVIFLFLTFPME